MVTYEIEANTDTSQFCQDDLWRLEFYAPIDDHARVLCWVNNMPRTVAETFQAQWRRGVNIRCIWCSRCPVGTVGNGHRHDALPEERGWLMGELDKVRIMPMREAA